MVQPYVLSVSFIDDCSSTILNALTLPDITIIYHTTHTESATTPDDSVGTTLGLPEICGGRSLTLTDVTTAASPPAYASISQLTSDIIYDY